MLAYTALPHGSALGLCRVNLLNEFYGTFCSSLLYICVCIYGHTYVHRGVTSTNTVQFMRAHLEACPLTCLLTLTHKHF